MPSNERALDLGEIRQRLGAARGKEYWRSLEEVADAPAFQELIQREFPSQAEECSDPSADDAFFS